MCVVTQCGCKSGDGVLGTIFSLLAGFVIGLVFLVRKVLVPLVQHVVAPAVAIAAVFVWRWLSGASMTGKARTATFRRGSVPPVRPARRFVVRLNWAHWPGYQRALVRWVLTALTVSAAFYPLATALTVLTVLTAAITARYRYAIAARFRADVIRVPAAVVRRSAAALTAQADAPVWSTRTEQAAAR
jgi:hypothetical protein